jgi:hypothetical protein
VQVRIENKTGKRRGIKRYLQKKIIIIRQKLAEGLTEQVRAALCSEDRMI